MFVGVARLVLQIPGARSLKDRRQVVRSFKERVKARLHISAAEVGETSKLQVAIVAVSVVSSDSSVCEDLLAQARQLASTLPNALLADARTEILSFGLGGKEMRSEFDGE
ncbi:MAG: hypothetical protein RJA70_1318 [Pseudomonadota bacterium]|jgi:uncharacterized protein YlxP (DUF503 family)